MPPLIPIPTPESLTGLIITGYATALLLPPIGFIIGMILLARNRPGSGLAKTGSAAAVAMGMGTSESILRRNYMALVTKADAERYWDA